MEGFSNNFTGDYFVNLFADANRRHRRYFVFHLGTRGFFAEITTVARAAIYAHQHHLQLVLDNQQFGYRYQLGWADYYEPFCAEFEPGMEGQTVQHCDAANRPGVFMREIIAHRPEQLTLGPYTIEGFGEILRFFMLVLCRPNPHLCEQAATARKVLDLPPRYAAVHIRRGDKVGWEDVYYPVDIYLERLDKAGGSDLPIFVMSDDYRAVQEFEKALGSRGRHNPVSSLCSPEARGFDVWALREKKLAYRHGVHNEAVEHQEFIDHTYRSAVDLVTETLIAARSEIFVGTFKSNVTKTISFLHQRPTRCVLLHPDVLKRDPADNLKGGTANGENRRKDA